MIRIVLNSRRRFDVYSNEWRETLGHKLTIIVTAISFLSAGAGDEPDWLACHSSLDCGDMCAYVRYTQADQYAQGGPVDRA